MTSESSPGAAAAEAAATAAAAADQALASSSSLIGEMDKLRLSSRVMRGWRDDGMWS